MSKFIELIRQTILPVLDNLKVELVDIEFEKKYGADNLTVFIETDSGVTLDDCEKIHIAIDPILDNLDPTNGQPYVLNVSSPGLDRPFKTQRDFQRNYGKEVEIKLYAPLKGKKLFTGVLICHDANTTTILAPKATAKLSGKAKHAKQPNCICDDSKATVSSTDVSNSMDINDGTQTQNLQTASEEIKIENTRIAYTRPLIKFS